MLNADVTACAALVERGDPERFMAAMASPVAARARLFPLYAFNVEVARAPWVTEQSLIAMMRLQWWRDALQEIADGAQVRRHEVVTPLAEVLSRDDTVRLDDLILARHWDIEREPFDDRAALMAYLAATSGAVMLVASRVLGGGADAAAAQAGQAMGLASLLSALPELSRRGRQPFAQMDAAVVADLADEGLRLLDQARGHGPVPRAVSPAFLPLWSTTLKLRQARANPEQVLQVPLSVPPLRGRMALWRQLWSRRF